MDKLIADPLAECAATTITSRYAASAFDEPEFSTVYEDVMELKIVTTDRDCHKGGRDMFREVGEGWMTA